MRHDAPKCSARRRAFDSSVVSSVIRAIISECDFYYRLERLSKWRQIFFEFFLCEYEFLEYLQYWGGGLLESEDKTLPGKGAILHCI